MAVSLAEVAHPNSQSTVLAISPFQVVMKDVTFDASYPTTGEVITAAQLGYDTIQFVLSEPAVNSAGTLSLGVKARPNTARSQVAVQLYETAGTVDTPHKEVTDTTDVSAYTARLIFFCT